MTRTNGVVQWSTADTILRVDVDIPVDQMLNNF